MEKLYILAIATVFAIVVGHAKAHDCNITVENAFARASMKNAQVGGGFVTLTNKSAVADRLIAASSPRAEKMELHEHAMDANHVMRMREVAGGIPLPPGSKVEMKPGGLHLMFIDLKAPLTAGEQVPVTLRFEHCGTLDVILNVAAMGAGHAH